MALKDTWKDLVDNVDDIEVKPINDIAHGVIENEKNKLGKETSKGSLRAYGVDNEGNQTMISTTASAEVNALLITDENGNSSVADPTEDIHIANKKFVDEENTKQNNIFANALKGEASGEMVLLTEVSPIEHEVKVKLKSKNLYDINWSNWAVSFSNGHFELNRSASTDIFELYASSREDARVINLQEGTYRISIHNFTSSRPLDSRSNVLFTISTYKGTEQVAHTNLVLPGRKEEATFTIEAGCSAAIFPYAYVNINEDVTVSFDIMLTEGPDIVDFVPSVPSDATVTLTTCGKNLVSFLDVADEEDEIGITFAVQEDGRVLINGTNDKTYFARLYAPSKILFPIFEDNGKRRAIYPWEEHKYGLKIHDSKEYVNIIDMYIEPSGRPCIRVYYGDTVYDNYLFTPQMEIGLTATEYEPYKEGETITTTLAEGAIFKNIYPNMSIIPDIQGVVIDVEYCKDTNIVVNNLMERIAALEAAAIS